MSLIWRGVQVAKPPEAQGFYTKNYRQMSMLCKPYLVTMVGRQLAWGSGCEAPSSPGVLYVNNYLSDEHAFKPYLVTLVGRELVWGPGGRSPGSSGVLQP